MTSNRLMKLMLALIMLCINNTISALTIEDCFNVTDGVTIEVNNDSENKWRPVLDEDGTFCSTASPLVVTTISFTNKSSKELSIYFYLAGLNNGALFGYSTDGTNYTNLSSASSVYTFLPAGQTLHLKYKSSSAIANDRCTIRGLRFFVHDYCVQDDGTIWEYTLHPDYAEINSFTPASTNAIMPASLRYEGKDYPVTIFPSDLFKNNTSLTSISLPETIETLGFSLFSGCSSLESLELPFVGRSKDAEYSQCIFGYIFGDEFFEGSSSTYQTYYSSGKKHTTYYIPNSLKSVTIKGGSIKYGAFSSCRNISEIKLPKESMSIADYAFENCTSLKRIEIHNDPQISNYAFEGCTSIDDITLQSFSSTILNEIFSRSKPSKLKVEIREGDIEASAFEGKTYITEVVLPKDLKVIPERTFYGCYSLQSVDIPNSVTEIGEKAFYGCEIKNLVISDNVTSIGNLAFMGCANLNSIVVGDGNARYDSRNNCNALIETATNKLLVGCNTSIIPDGITSIGAFAFEYCNSIEKIIVPNSVTSIGEHAFYGCNSLKNITLPFIGASKDAKGNAATFEYLYQNYNYFNPTLLEVELTGGEITNNAFSYCYSLSKIIIHDGVTGIGDNAFNGCSSLKSIEIPTTVSFIGDAAFQNCRNLKDIILPLSITAIGKDAFNGCTSLKDLFYYGNEEKWETISNSLTLTDVAIHFNYGFTRSGELYFIDGITYEVIDGYNHTTQIIQGKSKYQGEIFIPEDVMLNGVIHKLVAIYDNAFAECNDLETISFAGSEYRWNKLIIGKGNEILSTIPIFYNRAQSNNDTNTPRVNFYLNKASISIGTNEQVRIGLKNETAITGFQFELELPEGISLAKDNDGNYLAGLSVDRTTAARHNIFDVTKLNNGHYLVICSSTSNATIDAGDGEIATLWVNVDYSVEGGTHQMTLHNIALSDAEGKVDRIGSLILDVDVVANDYILGDANNSGEVNVSDITAVVSHIYGQTPSNFNLLAADVNASGEINVSDITGIVTIIYGGTVTRAKGVSTSTVEEVTLSVPCVSVNAGNEMTLPIYIDNAGAVSAFQFDLSLPDGVMANDVRCTSDRHLSIGRYMDDGKYRIMTYSLSNETFINSSAPVAYISLDINNSIPLGTYDINLSSAYTSSDGKDFVTHTGNAKLIVGNVTGINTIGNGYNNIHDATTISGIRVKGGDRLPKGIYIINGQKRIY